MKVAIGGTDKIIFSAVHPEHLGTHSFFCLFGTWRPLCRGKAV